MADLRPGDAWGRLRAPDVRAALVVLLFCAAAFWLTLGFERAPASLAEGLQPASFPQLVLAVMAGLALLLLRRGWGAPATGPGQLRPVVPLSFGAMVGFVLAFQWLGLVPAILFATIGIPLLWGERRWWLVLPVAVLFTAAIEVLFVRILGVWFEPGLLWPL